MLRRWRVVAEAAEPPAILVGETYVLDLEQLMPFYGEGEDELNLAFNFLFVHAELEAEPMRAIVEGVEARLPAGSWPVWTGSNHDAGRLATRWAAGDPERARLALMMLLTLRGTPFLYYGDEIGLPDVPLDPADALDPVPRRTGQRRAQPRPRPHADALDRRARRGLHRAGRRAVAAARRHRCPQRRRPARGPAARRCTSRAT